MDIIKCIESKKKENTYFDNEAVKKRNIYWLEESDLEAIKKQLSSNSVSKRFDFDKLLQDYRKEFVNGGGYVKSDTFEDWVDPYHVFEWFKKQLKI